MSTISDSSLNTLVKQVADRLLSQQRHLATAESCTGGWVAKCCTDLAGSSGWFERGFVTYSNEAKQTDLGVSAFSLSHFGAVSQQVAEEMALGVITHSLANCSVAITGIAGPGGATADKPIGTVWIAWAVKNDTVISHRFQFNGDREAVRKQAVFAALSGIIKKPRD